MDWLDLTLPSAEENLALDEALLHAAEAGELGEVLRLWEWPLPAVVLGSGGKLVDEVDESACLADGVPILRRSSGGGTVLLGRGCLCFSLILNYSRDARLVEIRASYLAILGRLLDALAVPGLTIAGISDLAIDGLKVSGNAQQRKRSHLLHHGTLLYAFDLPLVSRYLRQPLRQPEYRANRPHDAFVRNLDRSRTELVACLRNGWQAHQELTAWPTQRVAELLRDRYGRMEWHRRR